MVVVEVPQFSEGEAVEVGNVDEGFKGSWYAATIIQEIQYFTPTKKRNKKLLVEFQTLMDEVQSSKPLREYVDPFLVRPLPPQEEEDRFFEMGEDVDAFCDDGWWEGVVTQVLENLKYRVYLKDKGEELEFQHMDLRRYREWVDGKWVRGEELQMVESYFRRGALVEVRLDDENSRDAWFPATLLKRINNNYFLVEYQSLRLPTMIRRSKETVDSFHVRPVPPDTAIDRRFNLMEKVDAFYDCRWWSGIVTKVVADSSYVVSIKHRNDEKEFDHSELRVHMDWIDGKWITDSKESVAPSHNQGQIESPGQVQSWQTGNANMDSSLSRESATNVTMDESPGHVQKEKDKNTGQSINMDSQPSDDNEFLRPCKARPLSGKIEFLASSAKASLTDRKHKEAGGSLGAPASSIETESKGSELIAERKEPTNTVRQSKEDTSKEIEMDGASNSNSDSLQPLLVLANESYVPPATVDNGISSNNQPTTQCVKAITRRNSPIRDPELQKFVVDNSITLGIATFGTQLDEEMGEVDECGLRSLPNNIIPDERPLAKECLPFIKKTHLWENVESLEVFQMMPQKPHFLPLEQCNVNLREGHAIGSMLNFAMLADSICNTKFCDPKSLLQDRLEALPELEDLGFNVEPMRSRLKDLLQIKEEQGRLIGELMAAEELFNKEQHEEHQLEVQLDEMEKKIRELQESLNNLKKKRESTSMEKQMKDLCLSELKSTLDAIRSRICESRREFDSVVSARWH